MSNQIKLKRASGSDPSASDLVLGEPAVRTDTGEIFLKKDDGSIAKVAGGIDDGDKGDITVSNSGGTFTIDSGVVTTAKIDTQAVTVAKLANNAVINSRVDASAAIAGTKISPDFGSQNIVTTGTLACTDITSSDGTPSIKLNDSANNQFAFIDGNSGNLVLHSDKGGTGSSSTMKFGIDNAIKMTLDASGNLSLNGTVDGRDLATDGSKLDGIESGATADQSASEILTLLKTVDGSGSGLDADLLDGANPSVSASNNTIVKRHSSGYIFANYFNTTPNTVSSGVTQVCVETGNDGYIRHGTAAAIRTFINVADGATNVSNNNQLTNGAGYITSADGGNAATLDGIDSSQFLRSDASDTMTGSLTIGDGSAQTELLIKKADNNVSDHIQFYNGTTRVGEIGCEDTSWLRINQETAKNIYTPRYIRADGGFFVDSTAKGINGSGNFIGGTIAGASDYSTLLRSDTADTASGDITFSGGAGAVTIAANSDISFTSGTWSGNHVKIQNHSNYLFIVGGSSGIVFRENDTNRWQIEDSGHFIPSSDSAYQIGSSGLRVLAGYFDAVDSSEVRVNSGILETKSTIASSFTLTSGYNAMAVSPTVNSGVTVTVPSGAVWAIV